MNEILRRKDFISKIYSPMIEQKEYENLVEINEGLLKNLFGMVKNMFKKDWENVEGDPEIIRLYKEFDDKLTGFSIMKLSNRDKCNQIRQELVNFAGSWYDLKLNKAKENNANVKPAKSMIFKDETLKNNLDNCQSNIREIADGDNQMTKWAQLLTNNMKNIINQAILDDIEDEEIKKKIENEYKESLKDPDFYNKEMEKIQNDELKKLEQERNKLFSNISVTPIKSDLLGDKAIHNIHSEFKKYSDLENPDDFKNMFGKDSYLGFKHLYEDDDFSSNSFSIAYRLMEVFYNSLDNNDVIEKFKEVPGQSVQAMCVAVNAFIKNCIYENQDYGKALPLMAKCAIVSNGIISYGLPLNDKGDGNYFTEIIDMISNGKFNKDIKGKKIDLPDNFKRNADTLVNKIKNEAEKLKKDAEKKYNESLKKLDIKEKGE